MPAVIVVGLASATGVTAAIGAAAAGLVGATVTAATATAIGSGIVSAGITAIQGGDVGDILKSAVIGGVASSIGGDIAGHVGGDVAAQATSAGYGSIAEGMGKVAGGIAGGAASGATGAALSGGDIVEGALHGGIAGGVSSGVSALTSEIPGLTSSEPVPKGQFDFSKAAKNIVDSGLTATALNQDAEQAMLGSIEDQAIGAAGRQFKNLQKQNIQQIAPKAETAQQIQTAQSTNLNAITPNAEEQQQPMGGLSAQKQQPVQTSLSRYSDLFIPEEKRKVEELIPLNNLNPFRPMETIASNPIGGLNANKG